MVAFAKLLEQATSDSLVEIDWGKNMQIIDLVRQGDITGKECIKQIKKRMFNRNPNVVMYTLTLLEAIVKNCGGPVQAEVATKDFMDQFRRLVRGSTLQVKKQALDMIQTWARAFEQNPKYKIVPDTYNMLRVEGHEFPPLNPESDAMFIAETAPEWADGNECYACRIKFTMTNRKHHCRMCGQLFCQKCSSKKSSIPKLGIEKAVRVCDNCHNILSGKSSDDTSTGGFPSTVPSSIGMTSDKDLTPEQEVALFIEKERQAALASAPPSSSGNGSLSAKEQELKEREEIELAIALSMSEADNKPPATARAPSYSNYSNASAPSGYQPSAPDPTPESTPKKSGLYDFNIDIDASDDPMQAYLGNDKKDRSGGVGSVAPNTNSEPNEITVPLSTAEDVEFIRAMGNGVTLFEQKLARAKKRGGSVAHDTALQSIFRSLAVMHPDLMSRIDNLEDERSTYDGLKEKLAQIQSAGVRLKEVQAEQQAKLEQQRAEQAMLEKIQLEQKMKLLEQQAREQKMHQQAMEQRLRLQAEEQRRQEEARQLAAQEKAVRLEQDRLAAQHAELQRRRDEAAMARQAMEQQQNAHHLSQMHASAEAERHRAHAQQVLAEQKQQFAPFQAMGGMPVPPPRSEQLRTPAQYGGPHYNNLPPQQQQQQQMQQPMQGQPQIPNLASGLGAQLQPAMNPPSQMNQHSPANAGPPQSFPPNQQSPMPARNPGPPHFQQQQRQPQSQPPGIAMQPSSQQPPGHYGSPQPAFGGIPQHQQHQQQHQQHGQQYGLQPQQVVVNGERSQPPLAFQHQPPLKTEPEPLISFD